MKFTLTITDATREEINAIIGGNPPGLAGLDHDGRMATIAGMTNTNGHVTGATSNVPMPQNGGASDDDGPANANAPAVDSAGLPWDDRIHSKNKGLNADGTWRKKRNVNADLVASVEAALRGNVQHQPAQQMPVQQPVMMQQPQMQQPVMQQPTQQMMPNGIPPMPDQQMMQQPVMQPQMQMQQPAPMDFNAFMTHLAGQMTKRDQQGAPLITTDYLAGVAQRLSQQFQRQFNSITDIASDANVIAYAVNLITLDGRWS